MIKKIDQTDPAVAEKIFTVFQQSYAVEARLLKAIDFPPLRRKTADLIQSKTHFYGYYHTRTLVAVIEIDSGENHTHIQSLVVEPGYFRRGIARKLVQFVFDTYSTATYSVETGLANRPAISLYKTQGFVETKQWDTDHGVRKVRFKKKI